MGDLASQNWRRQLERVYRGAPAAAHLYFVDVNGKLVVLASSEPFVVRVNEVEVGEEES